MKNKMVISEETKKDLYCIGVYGMKIVGSDKYLYIGSGELCDCLSRHLYYLKRGLYEDTNKAILQKYYDMGILEFEVIRTSVFKNYKDMTHEQRENLDKEMSVFEQFYINLYRDSVCNKQMSVKKHSSNHDEETTYKRKMSNQGSNNPHVKYDEKMISEILWLKNNGYKAKDIEKIYEDKGIKSAYICCLGITKWIHLAEIKPDWIA
jgi:hypothetical protein